MMKRISPLLILSLILLTALTAFASVPPTLTGDAPTDFADADPIIITDTTENDVSVPPQAPEGTVSGWDVVNVFLSYDSETDIMSIGIDCQVTCGDADGNGDELATSPWLTDLNGTDVPNIGINEAIVLLIDSNGDYVGPAEGDFELILGVPSTGTTADAGLYSFIGSPFAPGAGFGEMATNAVEIVIGDDLEFAISDWSTLVPIAEDGSMDFQINLFAGSIADAGIGEDYLPGQAQPIAIIFPPEETETPTGGGEGCTPGYWKQKHHFGSWTELSPDDSFADVFGVPYDVTLLKALKTGGGQERALGRHAVAALLNATSNLDEENGTVSYPYSNLDVIALVQEAWDTGEFDMIKDMLEEQNEMGCPLGRAERPQDSRPIRIIRK